MLYNFHEKFEVQINLYKSRYSKEIMRKVSLRIITELIKGRVILPAQRVLKILKFLYVVSLGVYYNFHEDELTQIHSRKRVKNQEHANVTVELVQTPTKT